MPEEVEPAMYGESGQRGDRARSHGRQVRVLPAAPDRERRRGEHAGQQHESDRAQVHEYLEVLVMRVERDRALAGRGGPEQPSLSRSAADEWTFGHQPEGRPPAVGTPARVQVAATGQYRVQGA